MNYTEALEYIHSTTWLGSRPGLSRTQELLAKLGSPEKDLKYIHVAGTNGKGSVCSMCDSVLRSAGYRAGLYTSPYIVRFNERMRVDGEPISDEELAGLTETIKPIADAMQDPPTEFELITALAFLYFKRHECDVVVLEVGMGGRLDSTNVIPPPMASVITGIALDHTAVLGDTVKKIAFEKAGIIKPGSLVIYGGRDDEAFEVISARAQELGCEVVRTDLSSLDVKHADIFGSLFDYREMTGYQIALPGSYQPENAATVIDTVTALKSSGFDVPDKALREGLSSARWPARFELLAKDPCVVFDGSHNVQGVTAAVKSIKELFGGDVILLMGVLADKDYNDMVGLLAPVAREVFTITPPSPRALDSKSLAGVFRSKGVKAEAFNNIHIAVASAYRRAKEANLPLVMLGSLYMYGEVLSAFRSV